MAAPQDHKTKSASAARARSAHADDVVSGLPAPENRKFYPALDGLRAVAVLMVFYEHYCAPPGFLNWGWTGVDIFFVLSGFLITGILYDTRNTRFRFRNFYVRRTLRIFPLYYAVLLIGVLLTPIFHWQWRAAHVLLPLYLSNFSRFIWLKEWAQMPSLIDHLLANPPGKPLQAYLVGHFWSLSVEEQFYLVWPMIVFLVRDRVRLRNICLAMSVVCLGLRLAAARWLPESYIHAEVLGRATPFRVDSLLLGGALALMLRGPEAAWLERWKTKAVMVFVGAVVLLEAATVVKVHHLFNFHGQTGVTTFGFSFVDWFAASIVLASLYPGNFVSSVLSKRPLRRLGQVSYGFYVFHDIPHSVYTYLAIYLVGHEGSTLERYTTAGIALAGTLLLSFVSFRYFEAPFLRLKERFTAV